MNFSQSYKLHPKKPLHCASQKGLSGKYDDTQKYVIYTFVATKMSSKFFFLILHSKHTVMCTNKKGGLAAWGFAKLQRTFKYVKERKAKVNPEPRLYCSFMSGWVLVWRQLQNFKMMHMKLSSIFNNHLKSCKSK